MIILGVQNMIMKFTLAELNALNKLLGRVKFETEIAAEELHFFAMSPLIASAFDKIHIAFLKSINQSDGNDWNKEVHKKKINEKSYGVKEIKQRLLMLNEKNKKYIRDLSNEKKIDYIHSLFAPFEAENIVQEDILSFMKKL